MKVRWKYYFNLPIEDNKISLSYTYTIKERLKKKIIVIITSPILSDKEDIFIVGLMMYSHIYSHRKKRKKKNWKNLNKINRRSKNTFFY